MLDVYSLVGYIPPPIDAPFMKVMEKILQAALGGGRRPETLYAISRRWRDIAIG